MGECQGTWGWTFQIPFSIFIVVKIKMEINIYQIQILKNEEMSTKKTLKEIKYGYTLLRYSLEQRIFIPSPM